MLEEIRLWQTIMARNQEERRKIQITKKEWSYIDKTKVKSLEFGCKARSF